MILIQSNNERNSSRTFELSRPPFHVDPVDGFRLNRRSIVFPYTRLEFQSFYSSSDNSVNGNDPKQVKAPFHFVQSNAIVTMSFPPAHDLIRELLIAAWSLWKTGLIVVD